MGDAGNTGATFECLQGGSSSKHKSCAMEYDTLLSLAGAIEGANC